jgi:molecular chaperone DnaJ
MDFYVVLGLRRDATAVEIRRAYQRQARKYHPDLNPGDEAARRIFLQVVEAYETLNDSERRGGYDAGERPPDSPPATIEFEGFDFATAAGGPESSTFGDLFAEALAGPTTARARVGRGVDLHGQVVVSFDDAMRGAKPLVRVTRLERCDTCGGRGVVETLAATCDVCQGTGSLRSVRRHMVFARSCAACGGSGRRRSQPCSACGGEGVSARSQAVSVPIPAGVTSGTRVAIPGAGHAGRGGGEPGTFYVTVDVEPHPLFRRDGDDVVIDVPVAVHEAALGARIDIPTPDGSATLRVPPGTQSGQRFRLRHRGAPSPRSSERGDLVAEVRLVLPPVIDERSRELLREFGRLTGTTVREGWPTRR